MDNPDAIINSLFMRNQNVLFALTSENRYALGKEAVQKGYDIYFSLLGSITFFKKDDVPDAKSGCHYTDFTEEHPITQVDLGGLHGIMDFISGYAAEKGVKTFTFMTKTYPKNAFLCEEAAFSDQLRFGKFEEKTGDHLIASFDVPTSFKPEAFQGLEKKMNDIIQNAAIRWLILKKVRPSLTQENYEALTDKLAAHKWAITADHQIHYHYRSDHADNTKLVEYGNGLVLLDENDYPIALNADAVIRA